MVLNLKIFLLGDPPNSRSGTRITFLASKAAVYSEQSDVSKMAIKGQCRYEFTYLITCRLSQLLKTVHHLVDIVDMCYIIK